MTCEEAYRQYQSVLVSEARRFRKMALVDDLVGVGGVAFIRAYQTHEPERGAFECWLRRCVRNAMVDFLRDWFRMEYQSLPDGLDVPDAMEARAERRSAVDRLTGDARLLAEVIVDLDPEVLEQGPREALRRVKAVLAGRFEWTTRRYRGARRTLLEELKWRS